MDSSFFGKMVEGRREMILDEQLVALVAKEINMKPMTIQKVITLLEEGNTVPFIARYRKEATGGLEDRKSVV